MKNNANKRPVAFRPMSSVGGSRCQLCGASSPKESLCIFTVNEGGRSKSLAVCPKCFGGIVSAMRP
jgi:hypothetical protein